MTKKYGMADYIMALIQSFVELRADQLTESEKNRLITRCKIAFISEYLSAKYLEVT